MSDLWSRRNGAPATLGAATVATFGACAIGSGAGGDVLATFAACGIGSGRAQKKRESIALSLYFPRQFIVYLFLRYIGKSIFWCVFVRFCAAKLHIVDIYNVFCLLFAVF